MNKIIKYLVVTLIAILGTGLAYADGTAVVTTGVIPVTASVGGNLSFSWELYDQTGNQSFSWSAPKGKSSLNFGVLQKTPAGTAYYSPKWYALILYTSANASYNIQQGYTSLSGMGSDLDKGFVVIPDYQASDMWEGQYQQGSKGSDIIASASLVKNANILYAGNAGQGRILRFYYAIPISSAANGFTAIPINQHQGDYYGSVTVSMVAQ